MRAALVLIVAAACTPLERAPDTAAPESPTISDRREFTRRQFEAARRGEPAPAPRFAVHGSARHLAMGCPACTDPMSGLIDDAELLNGPMPVWD